jgi:hypothetical protein
VVAIVQSVSAGGGKMFTTKKQQTKKPTTMLDTRNTDSNRQPEKGQTMNQPFATIRPEIPRDHYNRPLVTPPEGGKAKGYTRCTTFVGATEDLYTLQQWEKRVVALGLATRPDLIAMVSAHRDDTKALNQICMDAKEAANASRAANIGTAIHAFTEIIDGGGTMDQIPPEYRADLEAYARATESFDHEHIEQFMVHDGLSIGGTPDRISRTKDGRLVIMDVKTGGRAGEKLLGIGKMAQQLAVYSRSLKYDFETNTRTDLGIETAVGVIIHLPAGAGQCDLVTLDLNLGWEGVQLCADIYAHRKGKFIASEAVVS